MKVAWTVARISESVIPVSCCAIALKQKHNLKSSKNAVITVSRWRRGKCNTESPRPEINPELTS
jgi:exosome complex RNA-binding protein Csl4